MEKKQYHNILLVTYPGQGQINPCLQLVKRLLSLDIKITLLTTITAIERITKTALTLQGLTFSGFSDGFDNGVEKIIDFGLYFAELETRGSEAIRETVRSNDEKGRPFTKVVYTILLPWAGQVAQALNIESILLWVQPATLLDIYYYYVRGYGDVFRNHGNDPSWSIKLPGLPSLGICDLPSFMADFNSHEFALPMYKRHIDVLEGENNPKVLANSFDELEHKALKAVDKLNLVPIGPLLSFSSDREGGQPQEYLEWLDSKGNGSVIYVSFGSYSQLPDQQMEEIAKGLVESKRPFLWVIRGGSKGVVQKDQEFEKQGKIVEWCSQVEVLSHPSIGCFVSHCGWNSSLESLSCGVPIVCFPLWIDQCTNAKLIEDVWEMGIRVIKNKEGIVEGEEIKRCIEIAMGSSGEKGNEMRRNAQKWKGLAREAAKEGGSLDLNLKNIFGS